MSERLDVAIVGAGQAGLATSHELGKRGVSHVVLERGQIGQSWRDRWESFCLVTPNWSMQLPDQPYDGEDSDAFDRRDEIVAFLERYAARRGGAVREGVEVRTVDPLAGGGFRLDTSAGEVEAGNVVLSAGAYRRPHRPESASSLSPDLLQIDVADYTEAGALPPGPVLVIGSGQSGCQIAEELHDSGREVFLSCGRAPWAPRRIGGRDLFWWLEESGFLAAPTESLPDPAARLFANILVSGHDGGHDLNLRTLHRRGVRLLGHFAGAAGREARFHADLERALAWGDERFVQLRGLFLKLATARGEPPPAMPDPKPLAAEPVERLDLSGFGAVLFAGGFRPDYASWVNVPGAFDELGFPLHRDGASTVASGLYFVGVHFLRTRKSALFIGVGDDAAVVAEAIAASESK